MRTMNRPVAATGHLPIEIDEVPLTEVGATWPRSGGRRRVVFRP